MSATEKYLLKGLDCPNCAAKIERALRSTQGLQDARVNFATTTVELAAGSLAQAKEVIGAVDPAVEILSSDDTAGLNGRPDYGGRDDRHTGRTLRTFLREERDALIRIACSIGLLALGVLFEPRLHAAGRYTWLEYALFIPAYLFAGLNVLRDAARNVMRGNPMDENSLMAIASIGAIGLHQLPEAVSVMLFYSVGESLQEFAVNRSRRAISALMDIRPERASVKRDGLVVAVPPQEVGVGEEIVVRPGERVPLDGEVIAGESFVDTSALTGEAVPRRMAAGDKVLAGVVATTGLLDIRVERPYGESTVARILKLVEEATNRKAKAERFISWFSRYYTPAVVLTAAGLAVIPPLVVPGASFGVWVYRALVLLVISCPCALVISVPLGYFGGIGAASRNGVLVKGANFLDVLANLDTVVFDKTGTLTKGTFRVTEINPFGGSTRQEVLETAARLEAASPHPIAASILKAYSGEVNAQAIADYEEIPGLGVRGRVADRITLAGNDALMHRESIAHDPAVCGVPGTTVHVASDNRYLGYIVISDELRDDAREAVDELRNLGVRRIDMLTGDGASAAARVAEALSLDRTFAGLLPGDKVSRVEELAAEPGRGKLAFVGDGINDAPVLTRADVGIAMGGLGSDAALEAADVVIMDDRLSRLPVAIRVARRTKAIVLQNISFALGVKGLFMVLGAMGYSGIWMAVFADVGVALIAVLNSTRVLAFRPAEPQRVSANRGVTACAG